MTRLLGIISSVAIGLAVAALIFMVSNTRRSEQSELGAATVPPSLSAPSATETPSVSAYVVRDGWIVVACAEGQPSLPPGTMLSGSLTWQQLNPGFQILSDGRCAVDPSETPEPIVVTDALTGVSFTVGPIPTIDPESGATFWTLPEPSAGE